MTSKKRWKRKNISTSKYRRRFLIENAHCGHIFLMNCSNNDITTYTMFQLDKRTDEDANWNIFECWLIQNQIIKLQYNVPKSWKNPRIRCLFSCLFVMIIRMLSIWFHSAYPFSHLYRNCLYKRRIAWDKSKVIPK